MQKHFKFFFESNRSNLVLHRDFMDPLPKSLKNTLIVHFTYDDVFTDFRDFFQTKQYDKTSLLRDIAFGLTPRRFVQDQTVIEEGDEVTEMYFVMLGKIKVGFTRLFDL